MREEIERGLGRLALAAEACAALAQDLFEREELEDLAAQIREILEREGSPCTCISLAP